MKMTNNQKNITITIKRIDLVKLIIACDSCQEICCRADDHDSAVMWMRLHDKLNDALENWDDLNNTWND